MSSFEIFETVARSVLTGCAAALVTLFSIMLVVAFFGTITPWILISIIIGSFFGGFITPTVVKLLFGWNWVI